MESLLVSEVPDTPVSIHEGIGELRDLASEKARLFQGESSRQIRIKRRNWGAHARSRGHQARCSGTSAAGARRGTAGAAAGGRTSNADAGPAGRTLHDASIHALDRLASFGAPDVGIRDVQVVARNRDVK